MSQSITEPLKRTNASHLRESIRSGAYQGPTGILGRGFVQANIVIIQRQFAADFMSFCRLNPKPCPLLAVGVAGDPSLPSLGGNIDIRTDVPAYRVVENGNARVVNDISDIWQEDFMTFALGCSFSFEEAIEDAGLGIRHNELGLVNPMYTTNIATEPAGPFNGPYVVTMRPFKPAQAIRAIQITSRFPQVHGAPIHFGDPRAIGIADLGLAEYGGDSVPIHEGEVPLFWACGVTSQLAVERASLPIAIFHRPASMLITDRRNAEMSVF